jgi:hypothetical protein
MRGIGAGILAAWAAAATAHAQTPEQLGTITFANSGSAAAQAPFLRGMKLYWSFEYPVAAAAFREAQKADPSFALAYAAEALTYTHQVWNEQDLTAARDALVRLAATPAERRQKAGTDRERMYLDLAEALYGDGSKPRRDTLFDAAAARLAAAYPADDEAQVFHALGLLGLNQGQREAVAYMQAGAVAEDVLRRNRDHPGAAHFVIHAFDDPVHAPVGLWAASLYSQIAPAAPHALHMTAHIFLAMGMWDSVVAVNRRAVASQQAARVRAGQAVRGCGHYPQWLHYGLLQAGRVGDADAVLAQCLAAPVPDSLVDGIEGLAGMRAAQVVDARVATGPLVQMTSKRGTVEAQAYFDFGTGYAAALRGDAATVRAAIDALGGSGGGASCAGPACSVARVRRTFVAVLLGEMARHDAAARPEALQRLEAAATEEEAQPVAFGPPAIPKPLRELRAELLLDAGRAADARREFQRALAATPGRARSLLGLAKAAAASGDTAIARDAARRLRAIWHGADKELPELAELGRLEASFPH